MNFDLDIFKIDEALESATYSQLAYGEKMPDDGWELFNTAKPSWSAERSSALGDPQSGAGAPHSSLRSEATARQAKALRAFEWVSGRPKTDVDVLVIYEKSRVTFAFRGTCDLKGWVVDANIRMQTYPVNLGGDATPPYLDIGIHSGFFFTVSAVYPRLAEIAEQAKADGNKIFVTGHSKGAGECVVFAAILYWSRGIRVEPIYNFGQPHVFNYAGRKAFARTGIMVHRVIDAADMVCRIPWAAVFWKTWLIWKWRIELYWAVGKTEFIDGFGELLEQEPWFTRLPSDLYATVSEARRLKLAEVNDHGVGQYVEKLKNLRVKMRLEVGLIP